LQEIIASKPVNIPIIANGDVFVHEDISKIRELTGADSVMIARGAIKNASIFQSTHIPVYDVMQDYMKLAITTDNHYTNTKYTLLQIAKEHGMWRNNGEGEGQILLKGKSTGEIARLFNLEEYYSTFQVRYMEGKMPKDTVSDISDDRDNLAPTDEGTTNDVEPPLKKQKIDHTEQKIDAQDEQTQV